MTFFFFLPSMLLSGFMFPFRGMPQWAQWLGEVLPLTHFLRIVRGILLKGNGFADIAPNMWPLAPVFAGRRHHRADPLPRDARLTARGAHAASAAIARWYTAPVNQRSSGPVNPATIRSSRRTFLRGQHCLTIRPARRCGHCSTLKR